MDSLDKVFQIRLSAGLLKRIHQEARLQKIEASEMVRRVLDHYTAMQATKRNYEKR